MLIMIMTIHI